jgi:ABC-2 type transport system ATP-binding protein
MPRAPPVTRLTRPEQSIESTSDASSLGQRNARYVDDSLTLSHVARSFGNARAVRDVSFSVPAGATFGLLGPNGAGKTTTMRMVLGVIPPDRGSIVWKGLPIDARVRMRCGYLPEERGLYGKVKVREQIAYFARLHGVRSPLDTERADAWIERLGLRDYVDRPCGELSKGNQQKVQFACTVAHEPELVILDEPFSGLDPANAEVILGAIRLLKDAGTTVILSTHQMWQIEGVCDAFCIIADGLVRAGGTLEDLRRTWPMRRIEVEPATPALAHVLDARPDLSPSAVERNGQPTSSLSYDLAADVDVAEILRALVDAGNVTRFERVEPSLQEMYLRFTGAAS